MAISSWSAHNSSVDIDLKSFRFTTVSNHDSIFEPSSSADNLSTRPIQNALSYQIRWSRGSTEEICVVQRKLDGIKPTNFRIPIAQSELDTYGRPLRGRRSYNHLGNFAALHFVRGLLVHQRPKKPKAARVTICGLGL